MEARTPRNSYISFSEALELAHVTFNISIFPPLFFFSGLYYTDVLSVLSVLLTYIAARREKSVLVVLFGLVSLTFRQTNVFWTALFLGGLQLLKSIRRISPNMQIPRDITIVAMVRLSWEHGSLYDPLVGVASIEDYLKTAVSLPVVVLANLRMLLLPLLPYILLLGAFAIFVVWNGGVVLGKQRTLTLVG